MSISQEIEWFKQPVPLWLFLLFFVLDCIWKIIADWKMRSK